MQNRKNNWSLADCSVFNIFWSLSHMRDANCTQNYETKKMLDVTALVKKLLHLNIPNPQMKDFVIAIYIRLVPLRIQDHT